MMACMNEYIKTPFHKFLSGMTSWMCIYTHLNAYANNTLKPCSLACISQVQIPVVAEREWRLLCLGGIHVLRSKGSLGQYLCCVLVLVL